MNKDIKWLNVIIHRIITVYKVLLVLVLVLLVAMFGIDF